LKIQNDTQPPIIEILDTQSIKTVEILDTQQILDSVLENNFGMDFNLPSTQALDQQFHDVSLNGLLDFFYNKSEEGVNVDVAVNDHHDENLDHFSKLDINDYQHQCLKDQENNDQGVHGGDYGDLIPTFDENLLNSHQLIDRRQMRDNDYDCQRLVDVENKRSQMRDNDQGYQRLVEVGEDFEDINDMSSNSPASFQSGM
jgi:hypothetical protein